MPSGPPDGNGPGVTDGGMEQRQEGCSPAPEWETTWQEEDTASALQRPEEESAEGDGAL